MQNSHLSITSNAVIDETDTDVLEIQESQLAEPELKKPAMYAVILYNDDFTPAELVVTLLQEHFNYNANKALNLMIHVHMTGKGMIAIYPKDIAETKSLAINADAEKLGYPLKTDIEAQPTE